jgi:hypothetical protein
MSILQNELSVQATAGQREIHSKLHMLKRASGHINSAGLNQVLSNMEVLAFSISWFGLVSRPFQFADPQGLTAIAAPKKFLCWRARMGKCDGKVSLFIP